LVGQKLFPQKEGMIHRLPFALKGWTRGRDLKPIADESFTRHWKRMKKF
jgi:hypothetical protein